MISHDDVRAIALELPGAFEKPSYGARPSFRTKSKMFAWIRDDPEALVVWVESLDEKEVLLASDPDRFFTIDHYDGHPMVLVSLDHVDRDEAAELIVDSWRLRSPAKLVKEWEERTGSHLARQPPDRKD